MEKCYQYFSCDKANCIMYKRKTSKHCWDAEGTLCCIQPMKQFTEKEVCSPDKCSFCLYRLENDEDLTHTHHNSELVDSKKD